MATYNGEHFIDEQLASLAAQERLPDELVVSDDNSTDATIERIVTFQTTAPFPVRLVRNDASLGAYKNFEKAARLCEGDLIFLCDQDDVWFSSKLRAVEACFDAMPACQVVMNDALLTNSELKDHRHTQLGGLRAAQHNDWLFVTGCCSAHRKQWQRLALPIPEAIGHDLWINRLAHELSVGRINEDVLQLYRRHGANASQWDASDPRGVSRWKSLIRAVLSWAEPGWEMELRVLELMIDRIGERYEIASELVGPTLGQQLHDLEAKTAFVRRRIAYRALPRWRRMGHVVGSLVRGDFRHASGWKSAIKDLIRS